MDTNKIDNVTLLNNVSTILTILNYCEILSLYSQWSLEKNHSTSKQKKPTQASILNYISINKQPRTDEQREPETSPRNSKLNAKCYNRESDTCRGKGEVSERGSERSHRPKMGINNNEIKPNWIRRPRGQADQQTPNSILRYKFYYSCT